MRIKKTKEIKYSAFSLIELSIVILIIGILIAGVVQGGKLFNKMKLTSARSLTSSSPVSGIKDLIFWVEATSLQSFIDSQAQDNSLVTTWYDINPQATQKYTLLSNYIYSNTAPTYKESCINMLPCLYFNGSSTGLTINVNGGGNPVYSKYATTIAVIKTPKNFGSSSANNSAVISGSANGTPGSTYAVPEFYIDYNGKPVYTIGDTGNYGIISSINTTLNTSSDYIVTVVDDGTSSIFEYVNGAVANSYSSGANNGDVMKFYTLPTLGYDTMSDGSTQQHFYEGGIAEIIVYFRALNTEERKSIEKYLSQKWGIPLTN